MYKWNKLFIGSTINILSFNLFSIRIKIHKMFNLNISTISLKIPHLDLTGTKKRKD